MRQFLRIAASLALSAVFLAIAVRGVSWSEVRAALASARLTPILGIIVWSIVSTWLRAVRWSILVRPLGGAPLLSLFSATSIGFAANMLLPLRAGEFIRPLVLARKQGLGFAPLMATIAVERLFDMATLLLFFAAATLTLPLPEEWREYGWVFLASFLVLLGLLVLLQRVPDKVLATIGTVLRPLPRPLAERILAVVRQFGDGLHSLGSLASLLSATALSLAVWLSNSIAFAYGISALDLDVPWLSGGVSTSTFVAIAVSIPGGPGFIGMFQVGCKVGLAVYGVGESVAFGYSVIVHAAQFSTVVLLGLYFFLRENMSMRELQAGPVSGESGASGK